MSAPTIIWKRGQTFVASGPYVPGEGDPINLEEQGTQGIQGIPGEKGDKGEQGDPLPIWATIRPDELLKPSNRQPR